jgi:SAM-dependent methyltransferase
MDRELVLSEMRAVTDAHGPWNAHNFEVADGVYTKGSDDTSATWARLVGVVQVVCDLAPRPIDQLRILDLACLEGIFGLEFAKRGAEVVGIEGRRSNLERASFAARALELGRVQFLHEDVRSLSAETHGQFDVVLCLGILYHLDAPDVFQFLERIADVCRGFAVIETHVSLRRKERRSYGGIDYWGRSYVEHDPASTAEQRELALRSSLDNPASFWLTKRSLLRGLAEVGFTTTLVVETAVGFTRYADRLMLVAFRGSPMSPELVRGGDPTPRARAWPERDPRRPHRSQDWRERARIRIARALPRRALEALRRLRRRDGNPTALSDTNRRPRGSPPA